MNLLSMEKVTPSFSGPAHSIPFWEGAGVVVGMRGISLSEAEDVVLIHAFDAEIDRHFDFPEWTD